MSDSLLDQERLVSLGRSTNLSLSSTEDHVVVSVQRLDEKSKSSYISDLWRVPLDGSDPRRLTWGKHNDVSPTHLSDGSLLFLSNRPTSETPDEGAEQRMQLFKLPATGGEPVPLTDEPLGVSSYMASEDGETIVLIVNRLPGVEEEKQREESTDRGKHGPSSRVYTRMPIRYWDHWLPSAAPQVAVWRDGEVELLTDFADRTYRNASPVIDLAGSKIAISNMDRVASDRMHDGRLELFDLESKSSRVIDLGARKSLVPLMFTPDGAYLLGLTWERVDGAHSPAQLVEVDLSDDSLRRITTDIEIEPQIHACSRDGKSIYATADYQGATPIFSIDRASGAVTRVTSEEAGGTHWDVALTSDGSALVGLRSALLEPPNPFSLTLDADGRPTPLADLSGWERENLDAQVEVTSHAVTSTDGKPCQYYVVKPKDAGDEPLPVVIWVHGGPIGQWGDVWHWRWNSLVGTSRGYIMVLPNPRGSTGFGHDWVQGIWGDVWGGQCYEDLMCVADEVAARDDVAGDNISVMGGSFGGYMTNWIGTQEDRFRCLITHAGLYNLQSFHAITDFPAYWSFMLGQNPYIDNEAFTRYSPHRHVQNWKSPTLIIHGQRDYRVPVGEAMALFDALQYHGVESEFLLYPDENHWILKPRNIKTWYHEVFRFIDHHAGKSGEA
ncbi:MAG: S9 family peptidase [Myxococcota bacterium]|nr:S9 family peptidase [Myxococcota bacterium]